MSCFNAVYQGCNCQGETRTVKVLRPCPSETTIRFDPCRGWLFDDPCCPFTYIGNTQNPPV